MMEIPRIDQWLYERLSGDATLAGMVGGRIYSYLAPQDTAFPFVLFNYQTGEDIWGVGPARFLVSALYQIKVVSTGPSFLPLKAIADRLDTLLQGTSGAVANGTVYSCMRERALAYVEVSDGVQYRHLGGLWRIYAQ